MCIQFEDCVCVCVHETQMHRTRKMGIRVRTGDCGYTCGFAFLSERDQWIDVHKNHSTCVWVCQYVCMHAWGRDAQNQRERWAYELEHMCVGIHVFLHFWETNGERCIRFRACMWMCVCVCMCETQMDRDKHGHVCLCVCSRTLETEPSRKMGIRIRAGVCGYPRVFVFLSKRDWLIDSHMNQSMCVCLWGRDALSQKYGLTSQSWHVGLSMCFCISEREGPMDICAYASEHMCASACACVKQTHRAI